MASQVLCSTAKIDVWETFQLTPGVFVVGLAFALPLILVSECMHHDYVVERWQPAQAVREAEEDENADFYTGMTTTQVCRSSRLCKFSLLAQEGHFPFV